jgi:hypothetical protein
MKLIKVALMVVMLLLAVAPVHADDNPPPCKPSEHDCRCDPGQSRNCKDPPPPLVIKNN